MDIELYRAYIAEIKWSSNDIKSDAPNNGDKVLIKAIWIAGEDESFSGDIIFEIASSIYTAPERDFIIIEKVEHEEYYQTRKFFIENYLSTS